MLPFSFAEYMTATSNSPNLTKDESLASYIYEGSLPQAVSLFMSKPEQTNEFLSGVLNTIIEKDVLLRHTINNRQAFYKVLDFVLDSVGSIVSPRSISDTLRSNDIIVDKQIVGNYLNYLCEAFFLYKVSRYDLKGKGLLQTLDKYYVADTGFRKVRLDKKPSADEGHLLENAVYLELRRRYSKVYIGKIRDNEVDFVAVDREGYTAYYQVALSTKDEATLERELKPLKAIRDSNPKYLLTTDWDGEPVYEGIRKLNVINWLLAEGVETN
jgi:predicted AAA+ superfamily ATPase